MSLHDLRLTLKPAYDHYADAVISLVGLNPSKEVLTAATRRNLAEAHALQIKAHRVEDPEREPFAGWDHEVPRVPSWFSKPISPIPKKLPILNVRGMDRHNVNFAATIADSIVTAGNASLGTKLVGKDRALVVNFLEQKTKGMPSRVSRQLEGWKDAAMHHLEEIARERGCRLILFNTAEDHSRSNNTNKPLHVELLETYGRLPMRHGFKLRVILPKKSEGSAASLWWIKSLKR